MNESQRMIALGTPFDFTPIGKRRARVVEASRGPQLRWYVAGRLYRRLAPTATNLRLSGDWAANAGAPDNLPQPWEAFE